MFCTALSPCQLYIHVHGCLMHNEIKLTIQHKATKQNKKVGKLNNLITSLWEQENHMA
jgi:hypothetical protein